MLQLSGELFDLTKYFHKKPDNASETYKVDPEAGRCSGLIKITEGNADLLMSHVAMSGYNTMNRVLKLYKFAFSNFTLNLLYFIQYNIVVQTRLKCRATPTRSVPTQAYLLLPTTTRWSALGCYRSKQPSPSSTKAYTPTTSARRISFTVGYAPHSPTSWLERARSGCRSSPSTTGLLKTLTYVSPVVHNCSLAALTTTSGLCWTTNSSTQVLK